VESCLLGGAHEPDRSIKAVAIRGSERGQPTSDRLLDEIVRGGRPSRNEKLVCAWSSAYGVVATSVASFTGGERGLDSIERMFLSCA
jgi:hypothetical protein